MTTRNQAGKMNMNMMKRAGKGMKSYLSYYLIWGTIYFHDGAHVFRTLTQALDSSKTQGSAQSYSLVLIMVIIIKA